MSGAERLRPVRRCNECGRAFDMLIDSEADEWQFGHDCEVDADEGFAEQAR
jgi:hypothetical protein